MKINYPEENTQSADFIILTSYISFDDKTHLGI